MTERESDYFTPKYTDSELKSAKSQKYGDGCLIGMSITTIGWLLGIVGWSIFTSPKEGINVSSNNDEIKVSKIEPSLVDQRLRSSFQITTDGRRAVYITALDDNLGTEALNYVKERCTVIQDIEESDLADKGSRRLVIVEDSRCIKK